MRHVRTPSGTWAELFRQEKQWRRLVLAEIVAREAPPNPGIKKMRSTIIKGLVATCFPTRWRNERGSYVFVSFGKNPLIQQTREHAQVPVICPAGKARNIIRGDSLCELDAIYHLIHSRHVYPRLLRKLFLGILLRWVDKNAAALACPIFITNHDYFDQNAVLVTLSHLIDLKVMGLQHGLLRHGYLAAAVYPGYRNRVEALFNQAYKDLLVQVKRPGSMLPIFGAPFDEGNAPDGRPPAGERALYFISSDDLRFIERRVGIEAIYKVCQDAGVAFHVRPHPQEVSRLDEYDLPFSRAGKEDVFRLNPAETVFVGYYSTFLYEAALRGYRTVWLTPLSDRGMADAFPEIRGVPNTRIQVDLTFDAEWLRDVFLWQPVTIASSPVGPRMVRVLQQVFGAQ